MTVGVLPGMSVRGRSRKKRKKAKSHRFTPAEQAIINRSMAKRGLKKGWSRGMDD